MPFIQLSLCKLTETGEYNNLTNKTWDTDVIDKKIKGTASWVSEKHPLG